MKFCIIAGAAFIGVVIINLLIRHYVKNGMDSLDLFDCNQDESLWQREALQNQMNIQNQIIQDQIINDQIMQQNQIIQDQIMQQNQIFQDQVNMQQLNYQNDLILNEFQNMSRNFTAQQLYDANQSINMFNNNMFM